ncbi:MAG: hypothetical protein A4S09_12760 [Proteobacteria bacterium SG_bin7]|nr:MAG: hypothetical protein A4S09_12760 [Proteobacteria bacterium SG_bin7]
MKILEQIKDKKAILYLFIVSGIMSFIWEYSKRDVEIKKEIEESPSTDTYVPEGFVLVPIEVQNADSLDAILGSYGVVDLFHPSLEPKGQPQQIAKQVKILRAPLDPKKFAVLVPNDQSSALVKIDTPLFVTIHNPKHSRPQFIKTKNRISRVQYE